MASGMQQGLLNMQAMQRNEALMKSEAQKQEIAAAQIDEINRINDIREKQAAGGVPSMIGQPAQPALQELGIDPMLNMGQPQPYVQPQGQMYPGEQPIPGLSTTGQPNQPVQTAQAARPATGLEATNPMAAGVLRNYWDQDPIGFNKSAAAGVMGQLFAKDRPGVSFAEYQSWSPDKQEAFDKFKGRGPGSTPMPADIRSFEKFLTYDQDKRDLFLRKERAAQNLDVGTAYINPATGQRIEKEIIDAQTLKTVGGDVGKRLANFESDLAVSEQFVSGIEQTQESLAKLAGMTDYGTTGFSSYLKSIPASDSKAWNNLKTTIISRLGLGKMMELKAASPTGSTGFGALNQQELELLTSNLGKLDQASSVDDIKTSIQSIAEQLEGMSDRMRKKMTQATKFYERNRFRLPESVQLPREDIQSYTGADQDGWSIEVAQ
jgi:hypothetical protein